MIPPPKKTLPSRRHAVPPVLCWQDTVRLQSDTATQSSIQHATPALSCSCA